MKKTHSKKENDRKDETGAGSQTAWNPELFFELSADLLCIAGYDGYFKKINSAVSKTLGYSEKELLSRPINEFVYTEDKELTNRHRDNIRKNHTLLNFENRYVTKSGEIVWLSWTSVPSEKEQLIYAIAKNITHAKKLEEERNALLTHLTRINNDLKQMTYTTSHDLRSPVNNLLMGFSLIDVSKIHDQEIVEFINMLKSSAEGLKQTLNNYVDNLSEKDRLNVVVEKVDLSECLRTVLKSISSLVQGSKATINSDFSKVKTILFNKAYLESIFLNLITNSIKYARHDCPPVITIYSRNMAGTNQLIITDNGLGFNMDKVKDKIFGLHQKFHDHADSKGIGLYLVYSHVANLGGHIKVESEINKGSTFTISFKTK